MKNQENGTLTFLQRSSTLKMILIGVLCMILLIPTFMIMDIIRERENRNQAAQQEVAQKWALNQTVNGPILSIPYKIRKEVGDQFIIEDHTFHLLPDELNIDGQVDPEILRRGIYRIVVYQSRLSINGSFDLKGLSSLPAEADILLDDAFLTLGISDMRGINEIVSFKIDDEELKIESGSRIPDMIASGISLQPSLKSKEGHHSFAVQFDLRGSKNLSFVPLGGQTKIDLSSSWDAPSFVGAFLPKSRTVNESGFTASWSANQLNRNYPQSWSDHISGLNFQNSKFGVDLILPLDDYQKSMRSAKYAILILALTFIVFFLVELIFIRKIHVLQYILVGLALCLFYILLVSISEHWSFDAAYLISSILIVSMITLYSIPIFRKRSASAVLSMILVGLYGFLFVIIQMVDYALVIGSIGLTAILGALMYFTKNMDQLLQNSNSSHSE